MLSAFSIRTLEGVAVLSPAAKGDLKEALWSAHAAGAAGPTVRDLEASLRRLGLDPSRPSRRRSTTRPRERPIETPGVDGRGYWAMRTSPWERPYIWAEAQAGRLRQGWGWVEEQDLDVIARLVRRGAELSEEQLAWPSRRMHTTETDGMRPGDLILSPNIPAWGRLCVFRLIGSYEYAPDAPRRFYELLGHVLPVEFLAGDFDRHAPQVSDASHDAS